jgi:TIGR03009 family protein
MAVWLGASTALYAQNGATNNNPLRGNPPAAGNQQNYNPPPYNPPAYNPPPAAQQPGQGYQQGQPQYGQGNPSGQQQYGSQPNYGGQQNPGAPLGVGGQAQPGTPQQAGRQQGGTLPNQAPVQPIQLPIQPPFVLNAEEQAKLDRFLADWEAKSDNVKTFSCKFARFVYDPVWTNGKDDQPISRDIGEIKYAAPDRGMFRVDETLNYRYNKEKNTWDSFNAEITDYWTCSGTSIYTVDYKNKLIQEHPVPKHMQGKAISDGPLPFVFGAKAEALKRRYYLKDITPPNVVDKVWLDVRPKFRADAQNYSQIMLILSKDNLMPTGMQMFDPGAKAGNLSRTVIAFDKHKVNDPVQKFKDWFGDFSVPNPGFGFKHVVVPQEAPAPPQAQPPAQVQNPGGDQPQPRQAAIPQRAPQR